MSKTMHSDYHKNTVEIDWRLPTIAVTFVYPESQEYFLQGEEAQDLLDLAALSPMGSIEGFILNYYKWA